MSKQTKPSVLDQTQDPELLFDIIQPLGEGAYGSVYKALDKRDGELVALKIMPMDSDNGSLEKEVRIMQKCKSPYIVNFRGIWLKDDNIWLAMEYCGGGSVLDIMKAMDITLTEEQICVIMKETLKGLYYLHQERLIHRDVKAGNILLNHKGQCKLADFGVSTNLEHTQDQAKTVIGTPYWMAPEVLKGNTYDAKADIWSLGITSIEMAKGRVPHCEKAPLQALFVIPKSPPPTLPPEEDWNDDFRDFIALCCTMEPEKRPTAAQLLKHKWIVSAKGLRVTQALVEKSLPIMEELRKQKVQAQMNQDEMEPDATGSNPTQEEEDNQGTFISPQNAIVKSNGNHNNDYQNNDDNNDDEAKGGTMLVSANSLIKNNKNDDEEENDDQFDGGTMVTPAVVSKPVVKHQQPQPSQQSLPVQSLPSQQSNINKRAKAFKSVFEGNEYIIKKDPMAIPDDVTKEELVQIWHKIRNTAKEDKTKFEEWYKRQFDLLDKWIAQFDTKQK